MTGRQTDQLLSARARRALAVLRAGGFFRHALETNSYTRREQFQTRLYGSDRKIVRGVGIKTRFELEDAGLLTTRPCPSSSTWPTEYVVRDNQPTTELTPEGEQYVVPGCERQPTPAEPQADLF